MLLIVPGNEIVACGPFVFGPMEYLTYRICDKKYSETDNVYFISQTLESEDRETAVYLKLARACEAARNEINSPWYYPSRSCPAAAQLEDILDEALSYSGTKFKDRYALQAARAMMTLHYYERMIEWWQRIDTTIKEDAVRKNIRGYLARAYLEEGYADIALEIYYELGDLESIKYCLKKAGQAYEDVDVIEYAAKNCPDNPMILPILQRWLRNTSVLDGIRENKAVYERYLSICKTALASPHCTKPAVWLYTTAFLKEYIGEYECAGSLARNAEIASGPTVVKESARILKMIIDARIKPLDEKFEAQLLIDLKWLDDKIVSDIDEDIIKETSLFYRMQGNFSYYYWNDMLRKIILGCLVPRMIDAGRVPLALTLSNYADNRLLKLTHVRKSGQPIGSHDYSCAYFKMLDTIGIGNVISHSFKLFNPSSELEVFLSERCYKNYDYLNELIGTRFLREMEYSKAIPYLSRVSESYSQNMNVSQYFTRKPFATGFDFEVTEEHVQIPKYKLSFAREMVKYMRDMKLEYDTDKAAVAKVMAGIGIKSSFNSHPYGCWSLTNYSLSYYNRWYDSFKVKKAISDAETMIDEGLNDMIDPELAAIYNYKVGHYRIVTQKYRETCVGRRLLAMCDELRNWTETS